MSDNERLNNGPARVSKGAGHDYRTAGLNIRKMIEEEPAQAISTLVLVLGSAFANERRDAIIHIFGILNDDQGFDTASEAAAYDEAIQRKDLLAELIKLLDNPNEDEVMRQDATLCLVPYPGQEARKALLKAVHDPDPVVRLRAASGLRYRGGKLVLASFFVGSLALRVGRLP